MDFGTKVRIIDKTLKSYNKVGLYVGAVKSKPEQVKVYLQEPIISGKTNISVITVGGDKIVPLYQTEKQRIRERINELDRRAIELKNELEAIDEEKYQLEYSHLGRS